jgi:hypothetical protein
MLTRMMINKYNFKTLCRSISKLIMGIFLSFVGWLHCSSLDFGQAIKLALSFLYSSKEHKAQSTAWVIQ